MQVVDWICAGKLQREWFKKCDSMTELELKSLIEDELTGVNDEVLEKI